MECTPVYSNYIPSIHAVHTQVVDSVQRASYNVTQRRSELFGVSSANILVVFVDISTANLPDDIQSAILLKLMIDDEYEVFVTGFQPSCTYCVYSIF